MAAITTDGFKSRLRAMLGYAEDSTGAVADRVNRLFQRTHFYTIGQRQTANKPLFAQTGSLSLTQPITEQPCYVAEEACVVQAIAYVLPAASGNGVAQSSVTVSTSDNWSLVFKKFKAATISQSVALASLTSNTDSITQNRARGVNACTVTSTLASRTLARNDVITVQVQKALVGAQFRGGLIKITVDEA
jgi:hypothetical protein